MVEPRLPGGIMLPSNTNTGSLAGPSSGRQKPLAGQCEPVLAFNWIFRSDAFRYCGPVIFFMAGSKESKAEVTAVPADLYGFILEPQKFFE